MREARGEGEGEGRAYSVVHVGVVHGAGGIRLMAAAASRAALMRRLAAYVRAEGKVQLYPPEAETLRALLDGGDPEGAVGFYFERVGRRWDREWLESELVRVYADEAPGAASVTGPR